MTRMKMQNFLKFKWWGGGGAHERSTDGKFESADWPNKKGS